MGVIYAVQCQLDKSADDSVALLSTIDLAKLKDENGNIIPRRCIGSNCWASIAGFCLSQEGDTVAKVQVKLDEPDSKPLPVPSNVDRGLCGLPMSVFITGNRILIRESGVIDTAGIKYNVFAS